MCVSRVNLKSEKIQKFSSKTITKLDQSKIEEHLSGRSGDYNGLGQITWFAGYVGI